MDLGLLGARVLVSGASRGIGRAIVAGFLAEGARVAAVARGREGLDRLGVDLDAPPDRLVTLAGDVGRPHEAVRLVTEADAALGGVDVVCANATANAEGASEEEYAASFAVDLMQAVRLTDAARRLRPGSPLAVICTSSIVGKSGDTPHHAYGTMKAALLAWTKNAAVTYGPDGVRVNAVAPGAIFFEDGWWDHVRTSDPPLYEATLRNIPRGRMGSPEEVANVVVFLASPRASHVNGATVLVDGGEHKGYA
jgi:3-oxoacyl-[acyl-carrier protein] reductase